MFLGQCRRYFLQISSFLFASVLTVPSFSQVAQSGATNSYPNAGRVSIIVPFAPGGATDIIARMLADELGKKWATPVLVENKAGAGGSLGTEWVAKAKADGYTLLLGTQTALSVNPILIKKLNYNVDKDFAPITLLADTPLVLLVSNKSGVRNVQELIAFIKSKQDQVSYGSSGNATSQHLTSLMLLNQINAKAVHIPYKGSSQSLADLAGNQIDMLFDNAATALAIANNGQAKALALTSKVRSRLHPELPTLAESGVPGFEAVTWLGLLAPASTPSNIINLINKDVLHIVDSPAFKSRLEAQEFSSKPTSPEAFRQFIRDETQKFSDLIRINGLTID
jgi:tripartite-type tricarboxylate transporter receptor subunit TctC